VIHRVSTKAASHRVSTKAAISMTTTVAAQNARWERGQS
jgi:hypothetical protein